MFGLLFFVAVIVFIIWLARRSSSAPPVQPQDINQQWVDYVAAYYRGAKNKHEKELVARMLADLQSQGMPLPTLPLDTADAATGGEGSQKLSEIAPPAGIAATMELPAGQQADGEGYAAQPAGVPQSQAMDQQGHAPEEPAKLDNTTLLLYFGAFLFLASAGLFVTLTGAYGPLRVAVVLAVLAALYFGGFWLHDTKPKLQQAGYTFIGMGMMLAPLAGLATYSYVMRSQPQLVWLLTSALCLALYGHALRRLKTPLMEYIFIGTFVSLFESAISVLTLPVYYYGWGFAVVGLLMQARAIRRGEAAMLEKPTTLSGSLLIPAAVLTALYLLPRAGYVQLGVSLMLASLHYGLYAWQTKEEGARVSSAVISQTTALLGAACFAYAWHHRVSQVAVVLMVLGVLQLALVLARPRSLLTESFSNTVMGSLTVAAFLAWGEPWVMVCAALSAAVFALAVWLHHRRVDMYAVGVIVLVVLPFIIGLYAASTRWHAGQLLAAVIGVTIAQLLLFFLVRHGSYDDVPWRNNWRGVQRLTFLVVFGMAIFVSAETTVLAGAGLTLVAYALTRFDEDKTSWLAYSSVFSVLPFVFSVNRPSVWLAALVLGFVWNLVLVFADRLEVARWLGSIAWLLLPVGIARVADVSGGAWYAWSYLAAMIGLVVARSVAQKRIARLPIALTELQRRLHTDSQAYVVGYVTASAISFGASFASGRVLPSVIGGLLAIVYAVIARLVERQPDIMACVPLLVQCALWGSYQSDASVTTYVAMSSVLALAGYAYGWLQTVGSDRREYGERLRYASLAVSYLAPITVLFLGSVWVMPVALFAAGLLTMHASWGRAQHERELSGGVLLLAVMWLLSENGVHNPQVYTHLLAALFGFYAYWRYGRGEKETGHSYLVTMLCTATIPLALQVLSGNAGGLYGWWFLGEQIAIMLLGMTIRDKFVVRWGLYVAVGAVLYQLRSLAWLALTFLAVFLIGLAVYQLQKTDKKD